MVCTDDASVVPIKTNELNLEKKKEQNHSQFFVAVCLYLRVSNELEKLL